LKAAFSFAKLLHYSLCPH